GGKAKGGEARGALLRPCRGAGGARPGRRDGARPGHRGETRRSVPPISTGSGCDRGNGSACRGRAGVGERGRAPWRSGPGRGGGAARRGCAARRSVAPGAAGSGWGGGEWVGVSGPGGLVGAEPGAATHGGASLCGTGPSTLPPHRVAEGYARRCSVRRTLNTRREENMMAGNRRGSVRRAVAGAVVALLALAGCGADGLSERGDGDVPTWLTTFTVLQYIAQNVAGDHLEVESITKIGAENHGYEPTPRAVAKASEADLILDNGLHHQSWF